MDEVVVCAENGPGPIFGSIGSAYLPYLCANAEAWKSGRDRFDVDIEGASGADPKRRAPFAGSGSMTGIDPDVAQKLHWRPLRAIGRGS